MYTQRACAPPIQSFEAVPGKAKRVHKSSSMLKTRVDDRLRCKSAAASFAIIPKRSSSLVAHLSRTYPSAGETSLAPREIDNTKGGRQLKSLIPRLFPSHTGAQSTRDRVSCGGGTIFDYRADAAAALPRACRRAPLRKTTATMRTTSTRRDEGKRGKR